MDSNFILPVWKPLHFLLLTEMRIAHIFLPVLKPGLSLHLLLRARARPGGYGECSG